MRIERQLTINELAERLVLSRSTVYYWVRDLPIPGSGGGRRGAAQRHDRDEAQVPCPAPRGLRGGEAADVLVQYHADQDLGELCEFWGGTVDVDPTSIRTQRKSNSSQLTGRMWRSRHGVLTIRTCDTRFRARMQAWMGHLRSGWQ